MIKRYLLILLAISLGLFMWSCSDPEEDDVTAPGAPSNINYDPNQSGDGQIYLVWDAPSDNDVTLYRVYRADGSSAFSEIIAVTETFYLDSNLDYTIEYSYKVTAEDESGNVSPFSNVSTLQPLNLYSPAPPSGLMIKAHNIPSAFTLNVELTWIANTEGDFSHYKVFRSEVGLFIPDATTEIDSLSDIYYYDQNVIAGTTYYYKLIAYDLGGKGSDPTNVVSDTPLEEPILISPIESVVVSSLNPTFYWTNVDKAVKYRIIIREEQLTDDYWESTIPATDASEMSITYPTSGWVLDSNRQYFWFVSAYSQDTDEVNTYTAVNAFRTP